jgi:FkbM family methyltransferase
MLHTLRKHIDHFRRFGLDGNLMLLKEKQPKSSEIKIKLGDYKQPIYLRSKTTDKSTFYKIFYFKEYNIPVNFNPKVILDLGANIGLAAVYFAQKYPNARIISVEPEPSNFKMLLKNTESYSNVTCLNYGVWSKVTNLEIESGYGNCGFRTTEVDYNNSNTIEAISIDKILDDFQLDHIDILKIDIEGSEKEIFEKNFERWLPKTNMIVIELHENIKQGCSKALFKAVSNLNYKISALGENFIVELN